MFFIIKKNLTILTCSKSLTSVVNPKLIYPSEIDNNWLKNKKKKRNLKKNKKSSFCMQEISRAKQAIDIYKSMNN